jgi:hypothetical protein
MRIFAKQAREALFGGMELVVFQHPADSFDFVREINAAKLQFFPTPAGAESVDI